MRSLFEINLAEILAGGYALTRDPTYAGQLTEAASKLGVRCMVSGESGRIKIEADTAPRFTVSRPSPMADYGDPPISVSVVDAATGRPAGEVVVRRSELVGTLLGGGQPRDRGDGAAVNVGVYLVVRGPGLDDRYRRLALRSVPREVMENGRQANEYADALLTTVAYEQSYDQAELFTMFQADKWEAGEGKGLVVS